MAEEIIMMQFILEFDTTINRQHIYGFDKN